MAISRRTHVLPDGLTVRICRLRGGSRLGVRELRDAALACQLYLIVGYLLDPSTGQRVQPLRTACYIGESAELSLQTCRVGVSLSRWATRAGLLEPTALVLIRRPGRPWNEDQRRLIECHLCRSLSDYTLLNIRTAAPAARERLKRRRDRLHVLITADRISGLVRGRLLHRLPAGAVLGTVREQIIRLVRTSGRSWSVDELVRECAVRGIPVGGLTRSQTVRRDASTRERDSSGRPRIYQCWVGRRAVFYPPTISKGVAIAGYRRRNPTAPVIRRRWRRRRGRR